LRRFWRAQRDGPRFWRAQRDGPRLLRAQPDVNPPPVDCAEALQAASGFDDVIDVRSESEFADDHIPGAINCPVLDDRQRAEVGTLHRQASIFEARRRGAALVSANIARHLEGALADKPRHWRPLVYCWRGGNRSAAMTHVLCRIGWGARSLDGGYRGFRRHVIRQLDELPPQLDFRVICGPTGSGKSRLLAALGAAGAQTIDLEDLAQHRGSVLGGMPHQPQPTQRRFETLIWDCLRHADPARPVYVESESRKVGDCSVPEALIGCMRSAACVRIELSMDERVCLLRDEYAHYELDPAALLAQLECLAPRYGNETVRAWKALTESGNWDRLVECLLYEHYDPAYQRSIDRNFSRASVAAVVRPQGMSESAFATTAAALLAK